MTAEDFLGKPVRVGDNVQFWQERDEVRYKGREAKTYVVSEIVGRPDYWGFRDVALDGQPDLYTLRALVRV